MSHLIFIYVLCLRSCTSNWMDIEINTPEILKLFMRSWEYKVSEPSMFSKWNEKITTCLTQHLREQQQNKNTLEIVENVTNIGTIPLLYCFYFHVTWNGIYVIFKCGEHLNKVCLMNNWCRECITDTLDNLRIKFIKNKFCCKNVFWSSEVHNGLPKGNV